MQGPETLYFLFDDQDRSLYVQNDLVLTSPSPIPLQFAPDGWEDIGIQNQRNQKYFVLDRSFTIPLQFVEDGARILKDRFYKMGPEEKVYLVIAKQQLYMDATHYGFYYTLLYKGELDFTEFSHEGPKVVVNVMEGGITKYVKANENVKFELPVDTADTIKIKWTGVKLRQAANYNLNNGALVNDLGGATIALALLGNESITSIGSVSEERVKTGNAPGPLWNANTWFLLTGNEDTEITLEWDFNVFLELSSGVGGVNPTSIILQLIVLESDSSTNNIPIQTLSVHDPLLIYHHKHRFVGSFTTTVPANRRCMLYMTATQNRDLTFFTYDNDGKFSVKYTYVHRTTYVKARRPRELYYDIVSKVSEGTAQGESAALETYKTFVVTSGDAIRGIAGAKIKTSLSDYFKSFNTILSIGMGEVNGKLKLERKPDWINYNAPVDLGECKGLKVTVNKDYLFSSMKIGFPVQEYEDVNGREEFNNTHVYTSSTKRDGKELDMVSVYRTDCYGGEFNRINLDGKTTTDSSSDNAVWVIAIKPTPIIDPVEGEVYELDRSLNPYATGLLEPETVFNLSLTPKQCLFRNGQYIRSCFYKQDTGYLRFQSTEKNSTLSVAPPGGPVITENSDVEIAGLGARLFVPVQLEFETRGPVNPFDILQQNPLKAFSTSYVGVSLVGIPGKTGIHPEDNEAQAYELLASPDTDLTQLIEIFE